MSCNRCAKQANAALATAGVPAVQAQAAWATVHAHLPRCEACRCFVSPRDPVCHNGGCASCGERQGEPMPWPPGCGEHVCRECEAQVAEVYACADDGRQLCPACYRDHPCGACRRRDERDAWFDYYDSRRGR